MKQRKELERGKKFFSVPINGQAMRMTIEDGRELYESLRRLFRDEPPRNQHYNERDTCRS